MKELSFTLIADGPTDAALIPILTFLLRENGVKHLPIQGSYADLRTLSEPPKELTGRVLSALHWYGGDLLFIHRDAERETREFRKEEINNALLEAKRHQIIPPVICVIPVRMTEAWLVGHEPALRRAAGNPNGKMPLLLPQHVERLPDPKETMYELLRTASGLKGRRLNRFSTGGSARRVAELTDDFSYLRGVSAFDALEAEVKAVIQAQL